MLETLQINFIKFRHLNRYIIMKEEPLSLKDQFIGKNNQQQPYMPHDRSIELKPDNHRKMTDICCIVAYCLLTTIIICAFFYSYILEKEKNIFTPQDPDGRRCGFENAIHYPYIYFPTPFAETLMRTVCISKCPTSPQDKIECLTNSLIQNCEFNMIDHFNRTNQFIVYSTKINNFLSLCQPDSRVLMDAINSKINTYSLLMNLEQIYEALYIILIACPVISILLVTIYVMVITRISDMRIVFKCYVLVFIISLFAFSLYSFTDSAKRIFMYMPILGIISFLTVIIFSSTLIYYREFYERSLTLLNLGAQYVRKNRSLIFTSVALFLIWVLIFGLQVIALVFIYSINQGGEEHHTTHFAYFVTRDNSVFVNVLLILSIIHYFWTNLILYHMGQYICMAASTFWILQVKHNFKNSLFTLLRFHIGSVILGSLTITFIGKITQLLYFFMPNMHGKIHYLCCCKCPSFSNCYQKSCFTNCMGIFTDLSYIRVAMKGEDLITGGKKITNVLIENITYVQRAYRLARMIVFISKILVALATTLICYMIIEITPSIPSYFLTNVIIFLFSSFLTSFAFDSYDRSFQVILLTILMQPTQVTVKSITSIFMDQQRRFKSQLYHQVLQWFRNEKESQLKANNPDSL